MKRNEDERLRNINALRSLQTNFETMDLTPKGKEIKFYIGRLAEEFGQYKYRLYANCVMFALEHDDAYGGIMPQLRDEWRRLLDANKDNQ